MDTTIASPSFAGARRVLLVPAPRKPTDRALRRFRLARVQLDGRERIRPEPRQQRVCGSAVARSVEPAAR